MDNNHFDFHQADILVSAVQRAADSLDVKNGQMMERFGRLSEYFKDDGYDPLKLDMSKAEKEVDNVIRQLIEVEKRIADYSEKLKDAAR